MKTPISNFALSVVAGLASGLLVVSPPTGLLRQVAASEIGTDLATQLPATGAFPAETAEGGEPTFGASPFDADEAELPDAAIGQIDGEISFVDWLPSAAADGAMVDRFLTAMSTIHLSHAATAADENFSGLPDENPQASEFGLERFSGNLAERNSYVAAEVAFALGNIARPDPDILFLAFVALQSLWGLACRPRPT